MALFLDVMTYTVVEVNRQFGRSLGNICQTVWCHIPENSNVNNHCHENLKCTIALLRATAEENEQTDVGMI
jgi:hypothetical protein